MRTCSTVFFGTPQLAVYVLEELEAAGIVPDLIVTALDKPAGRKLVLTPPAVKLWAYERGIPVLQTSSLRERRDVPELANGEWDLFMVAAYNIILPEWVLALPKKGVLNVHPSLLPRYRGPAPVRTAILDDARDAVGVTIIKLDGEVDHGPIVAQASVELPEWPVRGTVLDELLFREGGRLLTEVIPLWLTDSITPEAQDHAHATYSRKFVKADGELLAADSDYKKYLKYCAMDGWPGTFMFVERSARAVQTGASEERIRVKVRDAVYENGLFEVRTVIPEGKKEQPYATFLRTLV